MQLARLRRKIDRLDRQLIPLLNARAKISMDIGKIKTSLGKGIYSPERENKVLKRLSSFSRGPLNKAALGAIYREIMSASLALEKPLKVAYLGPRGTFSNLAAIKKFGSQVTYISCDSIAAVFLEVERGDADYGVVPVENSVEGAVSHTLDVFVDSDLKICSQLNLEVSHCLLSNSPAKKIKRIYSNPQVFGQCRIWLRENFPQAALIDVSSTSRSAEIALKEKASACIASQLASRVYGLKIVSSDIEDSPHNLTRFFVIGSSDVERTGKDKTSLIFSIKDRVGALYDMLVPFRKYGINLTKIESRPSKKKAWEYYFFVDLLGHQRDKNVRAALCELESKCVFLKVLGSYPLGE